MKHKYLAAGCVAAAFSGAAHAQDGTGVYIEPHAGIASVSDTDLQYYDGGGTFGGTGATDTVDGSVELKDAFIFGGTLGYDFGIIRADLEVAYSKNKVKSLTVDSVNGQAVTLDPADADDICDYLEVSSCSVSGNTISYDGGRIRQASAMANIWLDIPIGGTITPYVGGGAGIAGFETDGDGKAKFAWQLGAGVAFDLSESVSVTANYRHREVSRTTIEYDEFSGFNVGKIKTDVLSVGLRFKF
jgi:opacity protein-like surface antigen